MFQQLYNFLVIQNFSALVTLIVGSFAYIVYKLQKKDEKIKAARIVLSEIRNAERVVDDLRANLSSHKVGELPSALPSNSWEEYSYIFARDFDQDELELINSFYSLCKQVQTFAEKDNNFFWVTTEERAKVVQQKLAETVLASADKTTGVVNQLVLDTFKRNFLDPFSNEAYSYSPVKTVKGIEELVIRIPKITVTTCGTKLKMMAKS